MTLACTLGVKEDALLSPDAGERPELLAQRYYDEAEPSAASTSAGAAAAEKVAHAAAVKEAERAATDAELVADAGSDVVPDAAPGSGPEAEPEAVHEAVTVGVGVDDTFCADGSFSVTVQPKSQHGVVLHPLSDELSCAAAAGEESIACSVTDIHCDPGGDAPHRRAAVLLILDDSGSMYDNDPNNVRSAACRAFVDQLGVKDVVAVTDFGHGGTAPAGALRTLQALTLDKQSARDACSALAVGPTGTPIFASVVDAAHVFLPAARAQYGENVSFSVLLLSDGEPDTGSDRQAALSALSDAGFPVFSVGLGPAAERSQSVSALAVETLRDLSQLSGGAYASAVTPEGLPALFETAGSAVRNGRCRITAKLHADSYFAGQAVDGAVSFAGGEVSTGFAFNAPSARSVETRCLAQ